MAKQTMTSGTSIGIGTIVINSANSSFKLIDMVYVESASSWMFILQRGVIEGNAFKPGQNFLVKTTQQVRDEFMQVWTADRVVIRKGDAFKDDQGRVYFAETDTKVWSLSVGTWSTVRLDGDVIRWDSNVLTPLTSISGFPFSKYLG